MVHGGSTNLIEEDNNIILSRTEPREGFWRSKPSLLRERAMSFIVYIAKKLSSDNILYRFK